MKRNTTLLKQFPFLSIILLTFVTLMFSSCDNSKTTGSRSNKESSIEAEGGIRSERIVYTSGNDTLIGYLFYDSSSEEARPGIIVVHEWWGNNEYPRMRARQLAELGYTAFAADMYGNGKIVGTPQEAQQLAGQIYSDPQILKKRMMAAYDTLSKMSQTDKSKIGAIGYCFGGTVSLNAASMGVPLDAVVSFHGGLKGFTSSPEMKQTYVLVCNGRSDEFITREDIRNFKKEMEKNGIAYEFKEYEGATHAFTNPNSTETGKKYQIPIAYNETADKASWQDMKDFFDKNFPAR